MKKMIIRKGFTKGIEATLDPSVVSYNALWKSKNVRSDESGVLRIRDGVRKYLSSIGKGDIQAIIEAFGKFLFVWNGNVYTADNDGYKNIGSVGVTSRVSMIHWSRGGSEIVYIFTGNGIYETDGTSVSLVTPYAAEDAGETPNLIKNDTDGSQDLSSGPAQCSLSALKASLSQRLAVAGFPNSPNTVYLSAPLDATYFPNDQIIQLPDDGGKITGLANWYNALIIFRDRDIWAFFGSDVTDPSAALVLQDSSVGCVDSRTIQAVTNVGLVFLGHDNVYALQGVTAVENQAKAVPLGDHIRAYLTKINQYPDWLDGVSSVYYNHEYRLSLPNAVTEEKVFRLSTQYGSNWYTDTGPITSSFVVKDNQLYGTKYGECQIYEFGKTLLDDEEGIPFYVAFRREDLQPGVARIKKLYLYVLVKGREVKGKTQFFGDVFGEFLFNDSKEYEVTISLGSTQTFDCTLIVDGNEFKVEELTVKTKKVSSLEFDKFEPVQIYEARFSPSLKGHFVQLRVEAKQKGEDIALLGYAIEYSTRGRIRAIKE